MHDPQPDSTTLQSDEVQPAVRHPGRCGIRRRCYRASCRAQFGGWLTVELVGGEALFFCHGVRRPLDHVVRAMLA